MTSIEVTTSIIAALAAALSIILGLRKLVGGTRRVSVHCKIAVAYPPGGGIWEFVVVQAVNKHARPVTIMEAGLRMSDGQFYTQAASKMGRKPLPSKLDLGDEIEIKFDLPELEKVLEEKRPTRVALTRAFVRDAEGKEYASLLPKILQDKGLVKGR